MDTCIFFNVLCDKLRFNVFSSLKTYESIREGEFLRREALRKSLENVWAEGSCEGLLMVSYAFIKPSFCRCPAFSRWV